MNLLLLRCIRFIKRELASVVAVVLDVESYASHGFLVVLFALELALRRMLERCNDELGWATVASPIKQAKYDLPDHHKDSSNGDCCTEITRSKELA